MDFLANQYMAIGLMLITYLLFQVRILAGREFKVTIGEISGSRYLSSSLHILTHEGHSNIQLRPLIHSLNSYKTSTVGC